MVVVVTVIVVDVTHPNQSDEVVSAAWRCAPPQLRKAKLEEGLS